MANLENLKKHQGQLSNTGVRVAVVFRKIPNDNENCLLVETERLPDSYHDAVIQILNSREALETNEFYEVLNRRTFPDGTNCLTTLHQKGFLRKEPIANVTMYPLPNQPVALALINATIDKKLDEYKASLEQKPEKEADTRTPEEKQKAAEELAARMQDPAANAKKLLVEAEALEKQAEAKREEAYALSPDLKPTRGRPSTPDELKAQILEDRKLKRRERDRAKAAASKVEKSETALNAKVEAKLKRDAKRVDFGTTKE